MTSTGTLRVFYERCLKAIDLATVLPDRLPIEESGIRIDELALKFDEFDEAIVIAIGKAAVPLCEYVQPRLTLPVRGVVVGPGMPRVPPEWVRFHGGHPAPDLESFRAAEAIFRELDRVHDRTLVLFLVSGGGSAMVEQPLDPTISVRDCRAFHETLVGCGAPIEAINALRKHTSAIKGGRLAEAATPARQITFFVSDVPPHSPSAVASGPTHPDETTVDHCRALLDEYGLADKLPASYRPTLEALRETPKAGARCFARSSFVKLLDNRDALDSLSCDAEAAGWSVEQLELPETVTIEHAVDAHLRQLDELLAQHPQRTVAVVSGGEVNSPVGDRPGTGGRNLALALAMASRIEGRPIAFLCAGTDGIDGNSPAAGAVVDGHTVSRARAAGIDLADALDRGDAYPALEALGATIITGPTGNNVRDVRLLVAGASSSVPSPDYS